MTVREQVFTKLKVLTDEQLKQVADFLDFLKFREKKISELKKVVSEEDDIYNLGKNPIEISVSDASENVDKYLY